MIVLREYQKEIVETAKRYNTLVVLPTGTGKTYIALALSIEMLKKGDVLFLAPTKPLVEQHKSTFSKFIDSSLMTILTGEKKPEQRRREWGDYRIIFATPQTIRNDLIKKRINLSKISLIIFDEAHRGVGDYAYVDIAKRFHKRILALTASPGHSKEKIREICNNLKINKIEMKGEEELKGYIQKKEIIRIDLKLPEELERIGRMLKSVLKKNVDILKEKNFLKGNVRKRDLISLQKRLIASGKKEFFYFVSITSSAIKAWHCKDLLEMYGPKSCLDFMEKLKEDGTKAGKRLWAEEDFKRAYDLLKKTKEEHPKMFALRDIIEKENGKIMIFTQYRSTAETLKEILGKKARLFVGQARMRQKEQVETIKKFEKNEFRVLIATSIGEEGLHIPSVDVAIFFEPVPSALRMIQRKGRVGRTKFGKIYLLLTKKTSDEAYFWTATRKERGMKKSIKEMEKELEKSRIQKGLGDFS